MTDANEADEQEYQTEPASGRESDATLGDDVDSITLNDSMEIREVEFDALHEQDINPNVMSDEMFEQLVQNIRKRGKLESLPYVHETTDDGETTIEIISGHHRIRAAKSAGLDTIPCIVETEELSEDAVRAKQLAHNEISGEHDDQLVKRLYDSIDDVDYRIESFVNEDELVMPAEEYRVDRVDAGLERHTVNVMFLPKQLEDFDHAMDGLAADTERIYIADVEEWDDFKDAVNRVKDVDEIKSIAAVLSRMCEIVAEHGEYAEVDPGTVDDHEAVAESGD